MVLYLLHLRVRHPISRIISLISRTLVEFTRKFRGIDAKAVVYKSYVLVVHMAKSQLIYLLAVGPLYPYYFNLNALIDWQISLIIKIFDQKFFLSEPELASSDSADPDPSSPNGHHLPKIGSLTTP